MGKQAIDHPRGTFFKVPADELIIIGYDTDDGPEHPLWQERAKWPVDETLVGDIRARGILEPVGARRDGERLLCVYGRQRIKAARKAGVPVPTLRVVDDDAGVVLAGLAENAHRRQSDPILSAKEARRALEVQGLEEAEVAKAMGVTKRTIQNWMRYFELDKQVQKAIAKGDISFTAAGKLAGMPREEQREELTRLMEDPPPPPREMPQTIVPQDPLERPKPDKEDAPLVRGPRPSKHFLIAARDCGQLTADQEEVLDWVLGATNARLDELSGRPAE